MRQGDTSAAKMFVISDTQSEAAEEPDGLTENHGVGSSILTLGTTFFLFYNSLQTHRSGRLGGQRFGVTLG